MASKSVGYVELDVLLNSDELRKRLAGELRDAISKQVLPEVQKLTKALQDNQAEIDHINAKPLEEIAKQAGYSTDQNIKLKRSLEDVAKMEKQLAELTKNKAEAEREYTNARRAMQRSLDKEAELGSKMAEADLERLETNKKRFLAATKAKEQATNAYDKLTTAVERKREDNAAVELADIEKLRKERRAQYNEAIELAVKEANKIIAEARRKSAALDRQDERDQIRADKRAARNAERERKVRSQGARGTLLAPARTIGEIGRTLSGFSLGLSPQAFAIINAALFTMAGAAASASKSLLLLPAAVGAIGLAIGTVNVGMMGFSDTINALVSGDLDQFDHLINNLAPNAQQAALALQQLGPQFSEFKNSIQDALFTDAPQMITALTNSLLPLLQSTMTGLAESFNRTIGNVIRQLMTPETMGALAGTFANIVKAFQALEPAAAPFIAAFANLMEAGSSLLPQFAGYLVEMINEFAKWVSANADNGQIVEWIKEGVRTIGQLARLAWHFGEALMAIAPIAEQVLPYVIDALDFVAELLKDMPWLIYAIPAAIIGWKSMKGIVGFILDLKTLMKMMGGTGSLGKKVAEKIGTAFSGLATGPLGTVLSVLGRISTLLGTITLPAWLGQFLSNQFTGQDWGVLDSLKIGATAPVRIFGEITGNDDLKKYGYPDGTKFSGDQGLLGGGGSFDPSTVNGLGPVGGVGGAPIDPNNPLPVAVTELPPAPPPPNPDLPPTAAPPAPAGMGDMADINKILIDAGLDPINVPPPDAAADNGWGSWNPLPVPSDTKDERGNTIPKPKEQSDSDRMKEILAGLDPNQFAVDPYAPINGVKNQPGWPNQQPLNVALPNGIPGLPAMLPGMSGLSGVTGMTGPIPLGTGTDAQGAKPFIDALVPFAQNLGLSVASGLRFTDNGHHSTGNAGDFSNTGRMGPPTPEMTAFANTLISRATPYIQELIYEGSPVNVLGGETVPTINQPGSPYSDATSGYHGDHVHVAVKDGMAQQFLAALSGSTVPGMVPQSLRDNIYAQNGPLIADPMSGDMGYMQIDRQRVAQLDQSLKETAAALTKLNLEYKATEIMVQEGRATQADLNEIQAEISEKQFDLQDKQLSLQEAISGSFKSLPNGGQLNLDDLPFGDPRKVLGAAIQGAGGSSADVSAILGGVFGNAMGAGAGALFPAGGTPTAPTTDLNRLIQEGNPLALAQAAGLNVPDYTRVGGGASAQNLTVSGGPATDPMGRMYSDTASLIDRTFTNLDAANKARHDQIMSVLNQVAERLGVDVLAPALAEGVSSGLEGLNATATAELGKAIGQAAAGPIADAVRSATSGQGSSTGTGGAMVNSSVLAAVAAGNGVGAFFGLAEGGPIVGPGTPTSDSIPAMLSNGEYVLTADDVQRMGGFAGVDRFRSLLSRQGGIRRFAVGGGVNVDKTVGADFFGVSQIPLIGAIVNLLVTVLLRVINVQIEARDTLNEISSEVRQFRGDFQAFDAAGRLMSDTSGLVDRTGSSEQAAADERIRVLKLVIEGIFKFLIEKVWVPIGKAIGNALVQAGAGAASGAIGASFPGGSIVGGIVGDVITSAGSTAIDIGAEVATIAGEAAVAVAADAIGELIQSLFPGISNAVFGGGILAALFDPIGAALNGIIGAGNMLLNGIVGTLSAVFGGLATVIPGMRFDEGGVAVGTGMMPKATLAPERVLSPRQTVLFEKMVSALESGTTAGTSTTTIHAPFTVSGSERGGRDARDRLLALMS